MRKLLDGITSRLRCFVQQRDDLTLVLSSAATNALPLLKIIEGLEEESTSDFFWTFTDSFVSPKAYANAVVSAFATKHKVIRLTMEKEGMLPWPPIPADLLSEARTPATRLRDLAAFSRELLPIPNTGRVIWTFFPLDINDHGAFAVLMAELIEHEFPAAWCHHLRFIIRQDPANRALQKTLAEAPRVQWYEPDLSMDALNQSMEEELADPNLPLNERLDTLMVTAGIDSAHNRFPQALEKYELMLRYHAQTGNYPLAALSLNGMGEIYEKIGDFEKANQSYEAALVPASHGERPLVPVVLNIMLNLANLRFTEQRWADSEAYFDMTQQLTTANRDAGLKIRSLEKRGICQQRQGKIEEAEKSWNMGVIMAAQLQDTELCRTLLDRLRQHYAGTRQTAKEREITEQLAAFST